MRELTNESFSEAINSPRPVVVDFWAGWCMPCKLFAPVFEQLSNEFNGKAEFCKVNTDDCHQLAVKYGIELIPTVIVFRQGKEFERAQGILQKEQIRQMIERADG